MSPEEPRRPRMEREGRTVEAMVRLYCCEQHGGGGSLCAACSELLDYARARLERCPFQEGKTTCARCPVHCYRPAMREQVRQVMRYAGPRMLRRHPVLALRHLLDGRRAVPRGSPAGGTAEPGAPGRGEVLKNPRVRADTGERADNHAAGPSRPGPHPGATMAEKRKSERIDSLHILHFQVLGPGSPYATRGMGRTLNVSKLGVLLEIHEPLTPGQELLVTLGIEEDLVDLRGLVAHVEPGEGEALQAGIQFLEMDDRGRATLNRYHDAFWASQR